MHKRVDASYYVGNRMRWTKHFVKLLSFYGVFVANFQTKSYIFVLTS